MTLAKLKHPLINNITKNPTLVSLESDIKHDINKAELSIAQAFT